MVKGYALHLSVDGGISFMANKLAPYRNHHITSTVQEWWDATYPQANAGVEGYQPVPATILELYQSYCEYTLPIAHYASRLDINQFAKCLVATRIMDIDGAWSLRPNWQPMDYELRRAQYVK